MPTSKKPRRLRRHLSASGMVATISTCFERLEDHPVLGRKLTLQDCLLSALAMFKLKDASLLAFDTDTRGNTVNPELQRNLRKLFRINCVPSDTTMRKRLDLVDPQSLRPVFKALFAGFQRGGGIEYHHQMVAASLVHPGTKAVFPLMPELVTRADGAPRRMPDTHLLLAERCSVECQHPRPQGQCPGPEGTHSGANDPLGWWPDTA